VLRRVCSGMAGVLDLMIEINYYSKPMAHNASVAVK
jgi:hypothetical protein